MRIYQTEAYNKNIQHKSIVHKLITPPTINASRLLRELIIPRREFRAGT